MNFTLTAAEEKKLRERYGDLFYKAYKKEVLEELNRREMIDKLLNQDNKKQDNNKYGHLLDKYIR